MKQSHLATNVVVNLFLILFCVICLVPMLLTISVSFTDSTAIQTHGYQLIPSKFSLLAYTYILKNPQQLLAGYKNSLTITIIGTILNLLVTALVAYPLSRRDFIYRNIISFFIFFTMIFSGGMVPFYILIVRYLHWKNMLISLIVPVIAAPFNIFLLRVFFQDIPPSLIEAAKIDGASDMLTFWKIILPLSKAAMATVGLIIALGYWNEAINAMLFIDDSKKYPIQLVLQNITAYLELVRNGALDASGHAVDPSTVPTESMMYAMMVLTSLPVMFLFTFLQKYFVKGMTIGAVKG